MSFCERVKVVHGLSRSQFLFQSYLRLGCGAQADGRYHSHLYSVLWERVSLSSYVECTADDCAVTPFYLQHVLCSF